jgi:DnaD/phage-associated family protein
MAERRMFTKKVTDSDSFIELPSSAQALYFHLNQGADDDGFNNQIQNAMFKSHATTDDLKVLMMKNFIIRFESGVIVIKHWRLHNTLRKDRYTPTNFQEEFKLLGIKDNGAYTLDTDGCQMVAKWLPQDSIGKDSIGKNSIDDVLEMYEQNFGTLSPTTTEIIISLENEYSKQYVKEAFKRAIENNKKSLAYVKGILKQWKNKTWEEILSEGKKVDPTWLGKEIKKGVLTEEETKELDDLLKEFE